MSPDLIASKLLELTEVRARITQLQRQEKQLKAELDPALHPLFDVHGSSITVGNVTVERRIVSSRISAANPVAAAAWAVGGGLDVFSNTLLSKAKLDELGCVYSDNVPILFNEPVPSARLDRVLGYKVRTE